MALGKNKQCLHYIQLDNTVFDISWLVFIGRWGLEEIVYNFGNACKKELKLNQIEEYNLSVLAEIKKAKDIWLHHGKFH